ncbi:elastase [Culex quinquefasciatus]|uniref:Elastase n=1 Tax=Culex quinquefasciatus TaxID=7176 RepID=B0WBH3_CULQU|nr:elastase [Culex quinquefasciatus]|eukprot:XP_001846056.1 elastase [Culex quinquefasciatus]
MRTGRIAFVSLLVGSCILEKDGFECGVPKADSDYPKYPYDGDPYPGQFPWFDLVYRRTQDDTVQYACGGTLISRKHVLSAKICATNEIGSLLDSGELIVRMGVHMYELNKRGNRMKSWKEWLLKAMNRTEIWSLVLEKNVDIGNGQYRHVIKSTKYYNQTEICQKDRGSIGIFKSISYPWYVAGIVDCTSPPFVPCAKEPNFKSVALVQLNVYRNWILNVTKLTSLQDKRFNEGRITLVAKSKTNKVQCGQRIANNLEEEVKHYVVEPYPGQWPWYGTVYHREPNRAVEYACGGTLISESHVLTSRLCAINANGSLLDSGNVFVRFGTNKQNLLNFGYAQHRQVFRIHQPVDFDRNSKNDIVIFEMRVKVQFNDYIQPICIGRIGYINDVMIGWGAAEDKQHLDQVRNKRKKCSDTLRSWYYNQTEICNKDRGSIGMYSLKDEWYLKVIVDCTKLSFDPCKKNYFFYRANTVQLNDYLSWIITYVR